MMKMSNVTIDLKVAFPAWSESDKSWCLLTKRSPNGRGYSLGVWFPKSVCKLEPSKHERNVAILTLPLWLFNEKKREGGEFTNLKNEII